MTLMRVEQGPVTTLSLRAHTLSRARGLSLSDTPTHSSPPFQPLETTINNRLTCSSSEKCTLCFRPVVAFPSSSSAAGRPSPSFRPSPSLLPAARCCEPSCARRPAREPLSARGERRGESADASGLRREGVAPRDASGDAACCDVRVVLRRGMSCDGQFSWQLLNSRCYQRAEGDRHEVTARCGWRAMR